MIKYYASGDKNIEEVEIARETAHYVFLPDGRRQGRWTSYDSYHNTKSAARLWLIDKAQKKVDELKRQLNWANRRLDRAKAIKID